jgi:hypothetical protein
MCCRHAAVDRSAALRQLLLLRRSARLLWLLLLLLLMLLLLLLVHYDQGHLRLRLRLGLQSHFCLLLQLTLRLYIRLLLMLVLRLWRWLLVHVQPLTPRCSRSILPRRLLCQPVRHPEPVRPIAAGILLC